MRQLFFLLLWLVGLSVQAQSTEKLYDQAKAFYDAKNYAKAVPLFQDAAKKGHKKAQYRLGLCYDKGRGLKEDDKQAFAWYGKAAQQGNADGQYAVGKCYLKGRGVAANQVRAKSWVMKAIRNPSGGSEVYAKIKQEAAMGDADATKILQIIK